MPWETADTYWAIACAALGAVILAFSLRPVSRCRCGRDDCGGGCL